jgi:hypothetical protein
MTPAQKRSFLFGGTFDGCVWTCAGMSVLLLGILLYSEFADPMPNIAQNIVFMAIGDLWFLGGLIVALDFLVCWVKITRSKKRVSLARQL